jgi:hypothetical protein
LIAVRYLRREWTELDLNRLVRIPEVRDRVMTLVEMGRRAGKYFLRREEGIGLKSHAASVIRFKYNF